MNNLDSQLEGVRTVAIAGHVKPDGDCVGSCLAAYNYIRTQFPKIQAVVYLEPIPNLFKFMAGADEIQNDCSEDVSYDLFIALDCGDIGRLGAAAKYFTTAKKTICIDHHVSNQSFADENYIFPDASSTSELIFDLIETEKITREIAECIYTGIIHDTGVFQYSCTSAHTMEIAGILMEKGIDFPKIVDKTFFEKTYEQNRILGCALIKSQLHFGGTCISTIITRKEMEEYHVLPKHLEGIVSQLRSTKGVETAIFLYENEDGGYKVSMRSASIVDVAEIAVKFGGGGHARAAGITMSGQPEEILAKILAEVEMRTPTSGKEN